MVPSARYWSFVQGLGERMHKAVLVALAAMLLFVAPASADNGVRLDDLRVERKVEPVGIDVDKPRFSWVVQASVRDLEQKAYRVQLKTGNRFVWDSGIVRSPQSFDVEYTGPKLTPATHYDWYVDVQTKRGWVMNTRASAPASTATPIGRGARGSATRGPARPRRSTAPTGSGRRRRPRRTRPPNRARSARRSAAR